MVSNARRVVRRVKFTRGRVLSRTVTPHTLAISGSFLFILGRNATDNYITRIPVKAVRSLLGLPREFDLPVGVLDIDPDTTEFNYRGRYPKFMMDDMLADREDEDAG